MDKQNEMRDVQKETIEKMRLHFVFNTLNAIRYMIKKQPDVASDMVYDLAKFMRGSCDAVISDEPEALSKELEFVKAYLLLEEKQRSKLTILWQVADESGYVVPGSVYWEIEKLLKKEIYGSREERTLVITREGSLSPIGIHIRENCVSQEIPVLNENRSGKMRGRMDEDDFGG